MADYANQHFLPKSYLKHFAIDRAKKNIGIYVVKDRRFIKSGGIKPQCRKLNFYGDDGNLEKELSKFENEFQKITNNIIEKQSLPEKNSAEFKEMLLMWVVTSIRNPRSVDTIINRGKKIDEISRSNPNDPIKSRLTSDTGFVEETLKFSHNMIDFVKDLDAILLVNNGPRPFITSDNPVIVYNQLGEKNQITTGVTGFASIGFQSIFPVTPELAIMLYDPLVYKLSEKLNSPVKVNDHEVFSLNLLHFLNNLETIYFNERFSEKELNRLHEASIGFDRGGEIKAKILYNERDDKSLDPYSGAYSSPVSFSPIELKLSFMNLTEFGSTYQMKGKMLLIRDSIQQVIQASSPMLRDAFHTTNEIVRRVNSRH